MQVNYPRKDKVKLNVRKPVFSFNGPAPVIKVNFENQNATITKDITAFYDVYKNGKKIFSGHINKFKMAPKSSINYPIPWGSPSISPGSYSIDLKISGEGQIIHKSYSIFVPRKDIEKYQLNEFKQPEPILKKGGRITLVGGVLVTLMIIIIVLLIMLFKQKRNKTTGGKEISL